MADLFREHPRNEKQLFQALKGRVITGLFVEKSLRTKMLVFSAASKLGASFMHENLQENSYWGIKQESILNTYSAYSHFSDLLVVRHSDLNLMTLESVVKVPIINAMCGQNEHSLSAIGRMYSILRHVSYQPKIRIGIYGNIRMSRPLKSLVKLLDLHGITVYNDPVIMPFKRDELSASLGISPSSLVYCSIEDFLETTDALFVAEGLPQEGTDKLYHERYVRSFVPVSLKTLSKMKSNSFVSVGMPSVLESGKETFTFDAELRIRNDKRMIMEDWFFVTQALFCYLLNEEDALFNLLAF